MTMHSGREYEKGLRLSRAGRHADAIHCFERALQREPHDSRVLFALGNTARAIGLPNAAEDFYRKVLVLEPERIEPVVNLANLLRTDGRFEDAASLLRPALDRNPSSPELWVTLGSAMREMGDKASALAHYEEALALKPDYAAALANLADLKAQAGERDKALGLYDRALAHDSHNAQARLNRSILHLEGGKLLEGWRDYAARLKIPGKAPKCDHKLPRWSGNSLKHTRLLVTAEQGVGDELMLASVLPDLARRATDENGSIILECEPRLFPLFVRSFPYVVARAGEREMVDGALISRFGWLKSAGGANAAIEIGSLPRFLRSDFAQFTNPHAYLIPDAVEKAKWRTSFEKEGTAPFVGVSWRSGKLGGARSVQYAPLAAWAEFLRSLPGTIICAQYDATAEEIAMIELASGRKIILPQQLDQKHELDRSCAMLSALDCVVSAPTAVSWLAAGAGVPTFKILYDTSWTAFGRDYEPFAPSCRVIMPKHAGDWLDVFNKATDQINRLQRT